MTFKSDKTGKHLREIVLEKGVEERLRVHQSLRYCYGTGSRATLASMMLASLGGTAQASDEIDWNTALGLQRGNLPTACTSEIAHPMSTSANDTDTCLQDGYPPGKTGE